MDWIAWGYFGLFFITFLSATILPLASEAVVIGFLLAGFSPINCLIVATIGNSLGGSTNYFIGKLGKTEWFAKLGLKPERIKKFSSRIEKHGSLLAFLAWVPVIGDPLMIALGLFRTQLVLTLFFMTLGKALRYLAIIYIFN